MRNRLSHAAGDWWGRDLMRKTGNRNLVSNSLNHLDFMAKMKKRLDLKVFFAFFSLWNFI
jgi:hypothetical protein